MDRVNRFTRYFWLRELTIFLNFYDEFNSPFKINYIYRSKISYIMFWRSILTRTFVLLVFALPFVSKGQTANSGKSETLLSDSARISLLTCSPGDELYSIFGHSAIRVSDPLNSLDVVFNYGTFDFYDPNFYPNFVRGHLNYILSAYRYIHFEEEYIEDGRWVYSQDLNITTIWLNNIHFKNFLKELWNTLQKTLDNGNWLQDRR